MKLKIYNIEVVNKTPIARSGEVALGTKNRISVFKMCLRYLLWKQNLASRFIYLLL